MNPEEFSWSEFARRVLDFVWGASAGVGIVSAVVGALWLVDYLNGVTK